MAGILIKGMEMPKGGYRTVEIAFDADGHPMALADGGDVFDVIPVPPHGDLVDRDEIIEAGKSHPTYKNSKIVRAVVDKACCLLKTATVVIPANKEE